MSEFKKGDILYNYFHDRGYPEVFECSGLDKKYNNVQFIKNGKKHETYAEYCRHATKEEIEKFNNLKTKK